MMTKKCNSLFFKRLGICAAMSVAMLVVSACGGSSESASSEETVKEASANGEASTKAGSGEEVQPEAQAEGEIVFEELVVVDNDECIIKITGINPDDIWGYSLETYLENKSGETTYMYSVREAYINGVNANALFSSEVAAGKKANETITFNTTELEENDVKPFTDIELIFYVYDSNNWSADPVAEEHVHIYPYGEEKAEQFVREAQSTDEVIVDNEQVKITVIGYEKDDIWGYSVNLFLENKTDNGVMFGVDEASVNGYMVDPFYAMNIMAGKSAFSSISWSGDSFEENNITEVEEIEIVFRAYNSENLMGDDYMKETIVLNP